MTHKILIIVAVLSFQYAKAQDIPVDYYIGRPLISIPVYTVTDRTLAYPIALMYDASGVKVDNSAGWVGQNWSISGGEVSREVRGLPDDFYSSSTSQRGWLFNSNASTIGSHTYPSDGSSLNCGTETSQWSFIDGLTLQDTEPDLFHFSAPGLSGSFVFDNTGELTGIKLIPYQDVVIVAFRAGSTEPINKFEITTPNGVKYTFGSFQSVVRGTTKVLGAAEPFYFRREYHQYKYAVEYKSAWKLTAIESPVGEKITLEYVEETISSGSATTYGIAVSTDTAVPTEFTPYYSAATITRLRLSTISSPHQTVTFVASGSGEDLLLDYININEITPNSSCPVKSVALSYVHLASSVDSNTTRRTFLDKVTTIDECKAHEPYKFEYDGNSPSTVALPTPGHPHQDIWGYYYNTGTTNHKYPKLYIYPSQTGINKISLYQKSGLSDEIIIPGINRIVETTSTAGTLSLVRYPSGASTTLTYEPHKFYNPIIGAESIGGGLRIASITIYDGITSLNSITKTYEYNKPDSSSSGKLLTLPTFWQLSACYKDASTLTLWDDLSSLTTAEQWKKLIIRRDENLSADFNEISPVGYEYVTEKVGTNQGKTVFQFEIPFVYGALASGDWDPTYVHIARPLQPRGGSCASAALNVPSFYQHPFVRQSSYEFERGLLIKTSFYKYGVTDAEKEFINEYSDKTVSASTVKGLTFEYIPYTSSGYYFMYGAYTLPTNKIRALTRTTERIKSKGSSAYLERVTDYTYGSDHAFLASTTSTTSENTQVISRFKYVKDYGAPQAVNGSTELQVRMIDALYAAGQTGTLVESTISLTPSGGVEKTCEGTLMLFSDFGYSSITPTIKPKEIYKLRTDGITSFALSSVTGSGTTRVFNKNSSYKKTATLQFKRFGDPVRAEDDKRQFQSFQTDSLSGVITATIRNAEAKEVIYSNFDQGTKYEFDLTSDFTTFDKTLPGRTGAFSLGGFRSGTASTKYLSKTLIKRPNCKYVFSTWYYPMITSGTHSLDIIIKNTSGTQLLTQTLTFTVSDSKWYYGESVLDLGSISNTTIIVEVRFSGGWSGGGSISTSHLDEVSFIPLGTQVLRNSYSTAFGLTSATAPDGKMIENELSLGGQVKNVRDRDRNIVQKITPTEFLPNGQTYQPISIQTDDVIYDNVLTYFKALTSCLDYSTIEWKVTTASNPTGGTFTTGSSFQPYTFDANSSGDFLVTLKMSHSSYGYYQVTKQVTVSLNPLAVEICVQDGAVLIDICASPNSITETESCSGTYSTAAIWTTTFSVSASGCSGTYTYSWLKRPYGDPSSPWVQIGTSSTQAVTNISSYEIKCLVSSSCSRTGESNVKSVYLFKSNPDCADPIAP